MNGYEEYVKTIKEMAKYLKDRQNAIKFASQYLLKTDDKENLKVKIVLDEDENIFHNCIFYSEHDNIMKFSDFAVKNICVDVIVTYKDVLKNKNCKCKLERREKTFIVDINTKDSYEVRGGYYYIFASNNSVEFYYGYGYKIVPVKVIDNVGGDIAYISKVRKELINKYPLLYEAIINVYYGGDV